MEPDQHSTPQKRGGEGAGGGRRDPGEELPRPGESDPEATPGSAPGPAESGPQPGPGADVIMSRLPRTRPQRVTGRRQRPAAGTGTPAGTKPRPAQAGRSKQRPAPGKAGAPSGAGAAERTKRRGTARPAPAPRATAARRTRATPPPAAGGAARRRDPAARTGRKGPASLPRLAVDGAVEAAKLPMKVGGRLTLRALDAVARSLRGR